MKILYVIPSSDKENSFIFSKREADLIKNKFNKEIEVFYLSYSGNLFQLLENLVELKKKINGDHFDIIHCQYGTITAFLTAFVTFRKKFIITFRGADINGSRDVSKARELISLVMSWIAMSFSDASIFVSNSLRIKSPRLFTNSYIIPTGVDTNRFIQMNQHECRNQLNLDQNKKLVLFYSSFNSPNKRKDLALGAINLLKSKNMHNIELLIIDGGLSPDLMPIYLNAVDALLLVSDYEGSPTMVQEAVACGTPVVSLDVGDVKEVLKGIKNSTLVDANHHSISEGIIRVLNVGKMAPTEQFLSTYGLHASVTKIICVYNKILSAAVS